MKKFTTRTVKEMGGTATIKEADVPKMGKADIKKYAKLAVDIMTGKKIGFISVLESGKTEPNGDRRVEGVIMSNGLDRAVAVRAVATGLGVKTSQLLAMSGM